MLIFNDLLLYYPVYECEIYIRELDDTCVIVVHPVARWWLVPIYPSRIFPNCDIYLSTSLLSSTDTASYFSQKGGGIRPNCQG